ncbi:glycosyltransferase [uncultured Roseobacter sp.]|uniref:glycosyltransferase family protein n=1 Tax=uncultured Roseobacter sp. TaxID=114847 RepID=UPI002608730F|nr:glycosyltransferase [uncultured Roseobacter sp.]
MRIMIVVTHLLGTGHLTRALTLARTFAAEGHASTVVTGGMPALHPDSTNVSLVQLPPLRSDGVNFTRLLNAEGLDAGEEVMQARMQALEVTLHDLRPDVLITELFPFGRRVLRAEFLHLLTCAATQPRPPLICASVRDILAPPSKPEKAHATENIITSHYDAVLVHSDRAITPLDISWPVTETLEDYLHYTGFVAPPAPTPHPQHLGSGEILVSAGGGDVGADLFAAAIDAARRDPARSWRLLIGGANAQNRVAALQIGAPTNAVIEPARPDFRHMLHHAAASISMAGYNTALDLLQTGTPAVFVPFDAGGEVEQSLRAKTLAALPGISVLPTAQLSGDALLHHLAQVMTAPQRPPQTNALDGARKTVEIVETLVSARR